MQQRIAGIRIADQRGEPGTHEAGGCMRKGDIVKFRNVVDAGDEDLRMILLEDPDGGRVLVESVVDMNIRPTYRYSVEDLELCRDSN